MTQIVTVLAGRHGVAPERVVGSGERSSTPPGSVRRSPHISKSTRHTSMPVCWANMATARFCLVWGRGRQPVGGGGGAPNGTGTDGRRSQPHRHCGAPRRPRYHQARTSDSFGVGAGLARMAQVIQGDERQFLTCSMLTAECQGVRDLALSLPRVVGGAGVVGPSRQHSTPLSGETLNGARRY